MISQPKTNTNDSSGFNSLVNKYFHFLCTKHGFVYNAEKDFFETHQIRIRFQHIDYATPSIKLWFKSEPKFTEIELSWLLKDSIDYEAIDKNLLEDNFAYFSGLLKKHMAEFVEQPEQSLLKGIKRVFIHMCKLERIAIENIATNLNLKRDSNLRKYYYYIKKKDRGWDPRKEFRASKSSWRKSSSK